MADPKQCPHVTLEHDEYGRPIIWAASSFYKCLPGTAVDHISNGATFSTRSEAIRWCRFELRGEIDWDTWQSSDADFPYMKNCDDLRFAPNFVATVEGEMQRPDGGGLGKWSKQVKVEKQVISREFNWWAKTADGPWNRMNGIAVAEAEKQS